ncbi:hypothetical protein COL922a_009541 [Colletotrichum nupharicola]|nr:hypothetical protein COL922a_009541 [Colletotrichum nupharicola]
MIKISSPVHLLIILFFKGNTQSAIMPSSMAPVNGTRIQDVHQNVGPGVQNNNCGPGIQYIAENINIENHY